MGSGSSTTQLLNAQKSPDSTSEGRHDKSKAKKKSSDQQRELDAISLANKYEMKAEEVKLLWKRFQQLGPDKSGHVDRVVFSSSEIYSNIFCTQVWGRIDGLEEDSTKISFEKFLTNMRQYQYESNDKKLRRYFDWMSNDDNQVTRDRLKIIVRHATHDEDEDSATANSKVDMMMKIMDPQNKGYISCDEFLQFIHNIPEDQLSPVLSFKILPDGRHHSEHSSQDTQPI